MVFLLSFRFLAVSKAGWAVEGGVRLERLQTQEKSKTIYPRSTLTRANYYLDLKERRKIAG